ncbi:hypothetical protein [Saccharopolyspora griseoalba]|uniref:Uncharacterized protein n=1 Tax=Saccharopolyspora griseoalba TaxID=1431848 RepID=A0ABW2LSQ8_9PSEU
MVMLLTKNSDYRDIKTVALASAGGVFVMFALAAVAFYQHRQARRETGVPIIAELDDLAHAIAAELAYEKDLIPHLREATGEDMKASREMANELEDVQRKTPRFVAIRAELAMRADRAGRYRRRDRHVRQLHRQCYPILLRQQAVIDRLKEEQEEHPVAEE